jgi:type II secretory pathway component PulF
MYRLVSPLSQRPTRLVIVAMNVPLDAISRFAHSLATCLDSGLLPQRALELSGGVACSRRLARAASLAAKECGEGMTVSDGLASSSSCLPHFVLPVLCAGEVAGRQVEALRLIHDHCQRLKPAMDQVRKAWLYPVVCILTGWTLRLAIFLYFGLVTSAGRFLLDTFGTAAATVAAGWLLLKLPVVKRVVDLLLLQLPVIREALVGEGLVLFFSTLRLVYDAGGLHVVQMFDLALAAVSNTALRADLARARAVLEDNGSFQDAFNEPVLLEDTIKGSLAAGALSGRLGTALEQIIRTETALLENALDVFNRIFLRLVAYGVAMSVVGTFLSCYFYSPGR